MRRTQQSFRAALIPDSPEALRRAESANVLGQVPSGPLKPIGAPVEDIATFYKRASEELNVLRRAAVTNGIYSTDRLVVEGNPEQWFVSAESKTADA